MIYPFKNMMFHSYVKFPEHKPTTRQSPSIPNSTGNGLFSNHPWSCLAAIWDSAGFRILESQQSRSCCMHLRPSHIFTSVPCKGLSIICLSIKPWSGLNEHQAGQSRSRSTKQGLYQAGLVSAPNVWVGSGICCDLRTLRRWHRAGWGL